MHTKPTIPAVKIARDEIEHILNLKASLDHHGTFLDNAIKYLNYGWSLVAIAAENGMDLDFENLDSHIKGLEDRGVDVAEINLGVYTGSRSGLVVLEVSAEERACLDEWGAWRSRCVAALRCGLEKHFYLLAPDSPPPPPDHRCYAEGAVTLLPPSVDPLTQERWQWRTIPWDCPRSPMPAAILPYLQAQQRPAARSDLEDQPQISWRELYCLISPHEPVLQAFAHRAGSLADYYEKLLRAAVERGLTDRNTLFSLLWYAPQGDARQRPEGRAYLKNLVSRVRFEPSWQSPKFPEGSPPGPGNPGPLPDSHGKGRQPLSLRSMKIGKTGG